jgi:hypothetical protein
MPINARRGESSRTLALRKLLSRRMRQASAVVTPPSPGLKQKIATDANGAQRGVGFFWKVCPARARRASAPTVAEMRAQVRAVFYSATARGKAAWRVREMERRSEAVEVDRVIAEGREVFLSIGLTSSTRRR